MKFWAVPGFALWVHADMVKIQETLKDLAANYTGDRSDGLRTVTSFFDFSDVINGYGCWCYFDKPVNRGHGQPIDNFDGYCKQLNEAYDCITMETDGCDPLTVEYSWGGTPFMTETGQLATCTMGNPTNACASSTCAVEALFLYRLMELLKEYVVANGASPNSLLDMVDPALTHERGSFDTSQCSKHTGNTGEKSCCGDYPIRYPYRDQFGSRKCCGQKTYNSQSLDCCNGQIVDTGSLC